MYSDDDSSANSHVIRMARLEQSKEKQQRSKYHMHRIQSLQVDFEQAWNEDPKVLALRIAIKVTR